MACSASSCEFAMITPLPAASPSALSTTGKSNSSSAVARLLDGLHGRKSRRGNPGAQHEFLGECFARFQSRGRGRGTDDPPALGAKLIHDSGGERSFRTDHGQVGVDRFGRCQDSPMSRDKSPPARSPDSPAPRTAPMSSGSAPASSTARVRGRPSRSPESSLKSN